MSLAALTARASRLSSPLSRLASLRNHIHPRSRSVVRGRCIARNMSSLPNKMKAVVIEKTGGTEVLQYRTDVEVPTPGEGEVLVRNEYVGVNYIDT